MMGHVDHGKSTFLEFLTGQKPDRLPEEKRRGMTIDLNYAWLETSTGPIGIVDVPGHRRYLKNTLAGCWMMDAFLFVVAADDGWMPQSEEHLQSLKGLGVREGLVILSKTDLVDAAHLAEVRAEVENRFLHHLGRTFPCVCFSVKKDLDASPFREAVAALVQKIAVPAGGTARFWIDRVFMPLGQGGVVTGTLKDGPLRSREELTLLPSGKRVLARSLQSHGREVDQAMPGNRIAIQLSRIEAADLSRGMRLIAGNARAERRMEVVLEFSSGLPKLPAEVALHVGTLRVPVKLSRAANGCYRLSSPTPLAWQANDRFLLRTPGGERLMAWGRVKGPLARAVAPVAKRSTQELAPIDPQKRALVLRKFLEGKPLSLKEVEVAIPGAKDTIWKLSKKGELVGLKEEHFVATHAFEALSGKVKEFLRKEGKGGTPELKELLGASRKHAVLLLERMDADRLTYLKDGVRRLLRSDASK